MGCRFRAFSGAGLERDGVPDCSVLYTLMLQKVLAQAHWQGRLTPRDLRALTPLIWEHVNPYGHFELDMEARLPID